MAWNNSHKREVDEAEEERDLEFLEASIPRDTQERMVRPMSRTRRNTAIIGDHVDAAIREDAALQQRYNDFDSAPTVCLPSTAEGTIC
jgi:hypothetical protein